MTTFSTDLRAAAVTLLTDYAVSSGVKLQVYPARPATIYPPTAFVDQISERIDYIGVSLIQRHPQVDVIVVHAVFDSKEAATQRDEFVDGFMDWIKALPHAGGANTTVGLIGLDDIPNYIPDWLRPDANGRFPAYYATRLTLEGLELS